MQAASAMARIKNCRENLKHIMATGGGSPVDVEEKIRALEDGLPAMQWTTTSTRRRR